MSSDAFAAIYLIMMAIFIALPSIIDRAKRNHTTRKNKIRRSK